MRAGLHFPASEKNTREHSLSVARIYTIRRSTLNHIIKLCLKRWDRKDQRQDPRKHTSRNLPRCAARCWRLLIYVKDNWASRRIGAKRTLHMIIKKQTYASVRITVQVEEFFIPSPSKLTLLFHFISFVSFILHFIFDLMSSYKQNFFALNCFLFLKIMNVGAVVNVKKKKQNMKKSKSKQMRFIKTYSSKY